MMNSNLGYKNSFPSRILSQMTSFAVESSSPKSAATRLSYISAASSRMPKSSSGVLNKSFFTVQLCQCKLYVYNYPFYQLQTITGKKMWVNHFCFTMSIHDNQIKSYRTKVDLNCGGESTYQEHTSLYC